MGFELSYHYSHLDKRNIFWFDKDNSCATLRILKLAQGHLRGVYPCEIDFKYPITAIAGENCSGKSTLLAMAICAFHNQKNGFKLRERDKTYYTFSDFFVQTNNETSPAGIVIKYQILHNNWRGREPGLGWQARKKKEGGRWNDYDIRVPRNVVYFGIQRIVPSNESSVHRAYRRKFSLGNLHKNDKEKIQKIVGKIIGKVYAKFDLFEHSKYRLPFVVSSNVNYSGFNMGAGESAVFNILLTLFEVGRGALLVIDEIELGLHEKAQRRLINELKDLCNDMHCQIICTTHSPVIIESLPPEARFFIESINEKTTVLTGISADYACGKLSGRNSGELVVFVEDHIGDAILTEILPLEIRERIGIIPIGSSEAVLRQLSARFREKCFNCVAFLDGDKSSQHSGSVEKVKNYLEKRYGDFDENAMTDWSNYRLKYLPGETWPEKWLIEQNQRSNNIKKLEIIWGADTGKIKSFLDTAIQAGKHNELYSLNSNLHQPIDRILSDLVRTVKEETPETFQPMIDILKTMLLER